MCVLSIYIFQGCHFRAKATQRLVVVVVVVAVFAAASASSHRLINAYYLCYCVLGKKASNFLLLFFFFVLLLLRWRWPCVFSKQRGTRSRSRAANTTRRDGDVNDRRRHKSANKACANCGLVFVLFYFSLFLFFFFLVFLCVFFRWGATATAPPNSLRRNRSLNFEPNKRKNKNTNWESVV